MSIDNNSKCVRSKYFSGQTAMDESLSDFQEVKQSCKGPKPAQKPNKPKSKKVRKHIKGQKDIRTAIKGKKNELLAFSKGFGTVCKKSGVDVDPEQLQLAIALSKSLQTESDSNSESSQTISTQDRVTKIRKTLQEYGFKVPEAKITTQRKGKKHRQQYKLLTINEKERHQNISSKYSQILFQNLDSTKLSSNPFNNHSEARVFNFATNTPYECMKDNDVFYVENLIDKSTTSGSLLRDWSEIPGRPISPNLLDTKMMNFKDFECSQDELDVILSGSIKSVKDIIAVKAINIKSKHRKSDIPKVLIDFEEKVISNESVAEGDRNTINNDESCSKVSVTEIKQPIQVNSPVKEVFKVNSPVELDVESYSKNKFTHRSCSPDIFDDELSSIMESSKPIIVLSQDHKTRVFTEDNFMDLTQCATVLSQNIIKSSQLSQNRTKRKSNDFMEITECIVGSSQPIREECKEIDLTQSPEVTPLSSGVVKEQSRSKNSNLGVVNVILNQPVNNTVHEYNNNQNIMDNVEDETIVVNHPQSIILHQSPKDDIDLTQSSNEDVTEENNSKCKKKKFESLDLTQSSNSSNHIDDLPFVDISNSQTEQSLNETMILNEKEYLEANGKVKKSMILCDSKTNNQVFNLTQETKDTLEHNPIIVRDREAGSGSNSFIEDFIHDHSENSKDNEQYVNLSNEYNNSFLSNMSKESANIDLTQSSGTSEEYLAPSLNIALNIPNNSSLGKRDDVSIDYDEILTDNNCYPKDSFKDNDNSLKLECTASKSKAYNDTVIVDENYAGDINSSQNSEVFMLSDRELDYSMHKSRHDVPRDNFDFGGISVLDNVTRHGSFSKSLDEKCSSPIVRSTSGAFEDSFLPEVNVKKTDTKSIDKVENGDLPTELCSPSKEQNVIESNQVVFAINTPKNDEYIIKTDNVTPMADYASMSTPQRNRELDKYGLKRFKRKRAIQILTHLYNSTHPTMQQLIDDHDQPSPSKRRKQDTNIQDLSPKKLLPSPRTSPSKSRLEKNLEHASPEKLSNSPKKALSQKNFSKSKKIGDNGDIIKSPKKDEELRLVTKDVCGYEVTDDNAVIKATDCSPDDWVFQKREKAKIHSCRIPLHIAFHNYVSSRRSLREAILKYEPVNIDVIHKDLVGYGHRYDPKELLKFLDKKCITVRTTDNNSRNSKR